MRIRNVSLVIVSMNLLHGSGGIMAFTASGNNGGRTAFVEPISVVAAKRDQAPTRQRIEDSCSMRLWASNGDDAGEDIAPGKRVVFIRHGCTHMNEYLSTSAFGSPGFTDVFPEQHTAKYRDSPLSPRGIRQAQTLASHLDDLAKGRPEVHETLSLPHEHRNFLNELDLVVVSPLTRAIQTLEISLIPHIQFDSDSGETNEFKRDAISKVPIIALPHAAERLYLISDVGKTRQELHDQYGHFIDFEQGFEEHGDEWWFALDSKADNSTPSGIRPENYVEWRPNSLRQRYACPGEPDEFFEARMTRLI